MAKKYTPPNWNQKLIAQAVGLDPKNVTVAHEDDRNISFLQYTPRKFVLVCKVDGAVVES